MSMVQRADRTGTAAEPVRLRKLLAFFLPLGLSASLVTLSHVIINSTLAQAAHPELIIASYAIGMSIINITEKPAILLRQSCSALVRDRRSFRAMSEVAWIVFGFIIAFGLLICYTPVGTGLFRIFFGVDPERVSDVVNVYRVLMFVSIFSGIRCLYHGVIIAKKRTTWLTIGMAIRLVAMYELSRFYLDTNKVTSGQVGAVIFLTGMIIESIVSFLEGNSLVRNTLPSVDPDHPVQSRGDIFRFYKPLLVSSFLAVAVGPSINAVLGKTHGLELSIAAFAIASSLTQLVMSFFSYMHQIVLNFYNTDEKAVRRFVMLFGFVPALLIGIAGYTRVGPWFMLHVLGVNTALMEAGLPILRIFMLLTLIFPWLDFCNGLIMLRGQTKIMVWSQAANVSLTLATLLVCLLAAPAWNGSIGALAQSLGSAAEFSVVLFVLRRTAAAAEQWPAGGTP